MDEVKWRPWAIEDRPGRIETIEPESEAFIPATGEPTSETKAAA